MSTRCNIGFYVADADPIKKPEALLYKHSDGYPDGVLPELIPFVKEFKSKRGHDPEYLAARYMQYLGNLYDGVDLSDPEMRKFLSTFHKYKDGDLVAGVLGLGICNVIHCDIEYFYAVYCDVIKVYECHYSSKPKDWELYNEISLLPQLQNDILQEPEVKPVDDLMDVPQSVLDEVEEKSNGIEEEITQEEDEGIIEGKESYVGMEGNRE